MAFQGLSPVRFGSVSMVTAALGANDPELGTTAVVDGLEYVFVYNAGGEDINPGYGCVPNSASAGYSVTVTSATFVDFCQGVAKHATLTTDTYGWVVTKGVTPIEMGATSGSVAALGLVYLGANGVFVPASNITGALAPVAGKALAAIVSSASGSAYIRC